MRKTFAAGMLLCSAPFAVAQQPPPHHPVGEVQWVSSPTKTSHLPTINTNIIQQPPAMPNVLRPPAQADTVEAGVSKGEAKGAGRAPRPEAAYPTPVVPATIPAGVTVLPPVTITPIQATEPPPIPVPPPRVVPDYTTPMPNRPASPPPVPMTGPLPMVPTVPMAPAPTPMVIPHQIVQQPAPIYIEQPTPVYSSVQPAPMLTGTPIYSEPMPTMSYGVSGHGRSPLHCVWFNTEVVYFWMKNGPQPDPLLTTGSPAAGLLAGAIGQPGTRVIYGGNDLDYDGFWGLRTEAGVWLDDHNTLGFSVGGFGTQTNSTSFYASDNGTSAAGLYIPALNVAGAPFENRLVLADAPLAFAGGAAIRSRSQVWGAEANVLLNVYRGQYVELTPMLGFRHISLNEELTIDTTNTDLLLGTVTNTTDEFKTSSRLYGGQLGIRTSLSCGNWSLDVTSKVAVGFSNNVIRINGSTIQSGALAIPPGSFGSGFFAQASNIGRRTENNFAVVPEVNARLSYHVASWLTAHVGYNFLYWNTVVRPGNQLNRNLNLTQSPIFGAGALAGVAQPASVTRTSDFYLHGLSAGLEFRY